MLSPVPVPMGAGQYLVTYTPFKKGTYTLSITTGVTDGSFAPGGFDIYCGLGAANKCSPRPVVVRWA